MSSDSTDCGVDKLDDQLAYHKEMEYIAMKVSDLAKAEHHRKMLEILESIKGRISLSRLRSNYQMKTTKWRPLGRTRTNKLNRLGILIHDPTFVEKSSHG